MTNLETSDHRNANRCGKRQAQNHGSTGQGHSLCFRRERFNVIFLLAVPRIGRHFMVKGTGGTAWLNWAPCPAALRAVFGAAKHPSGVRPRKCYYYWDRVREYLNQSRNATFHVIVTLTYRTLEACISPEALCHHLTKAGIKKALPRI
jgi:hypothetical protein